MQRPIFFLIHFTDLINAALPQLLHDVCAKIRALAHDEVLIVPGGWSSIPSGHAILFIVHRVHASHDVMSPQYTFTVCNTGQGLDHHSSVGDDVGEADKM
jgi:hypothetical protein